jgi:tetratricopeptide (TPR) repeat protein
VCLSLAAAPAQAERKGRTDTPAEATAALDPEAFTGLSPERQTEIAALWTALDRAPDDAALWVRLGDALAARPTQTDAAIAAYSTALLYDPTLSDAERTLAGLLTSRGYFGAALTTYESLLSRTAGDPDWLDLSMACTLYARTESLDRAVALLEHMLLIAPHDRTLLALGTVERARGNTAAGEALMALVRDTETAEPLLRALAEALLEPDEDAEEDQP